MLAKLSGADRPAVVSEPYGAGYQYMEPTFPIARAALRIIGRLSVRIMSELDLRRRRR